jgi:hypothetical protein
MSTHTRHVVIAYDVPLKNATGECAISFGMEISPRTTAHGERDARRTRIKVPIQGKLPGTSRQAIGPIGLLSI